MDKVKILNEIKAFLDGYNDDIKYLVNVETDPRTNIAQCIIHEPKKDPKIVEIEYEPFMYMKDLSKHGIILYEGYAEEHHESIKKKYGVTIKKLKTGNQKRLVNAYCYKITSSKSFNDILNYLREGGIDPYEKLKNENGRFLRDERGRYVYPNRHLFYSVRTTEQFFISKQARLYKGYEEYNDVHKLTFDIETEGLRYETARVFAIGVRDNRGFETILEVKKTDDDDAERELIRDFFNIIHVIKPAVISGYNSETFDFDFILGRAKLLKFDLSEIPTSLKKEYKLRRVPNTSVKYGNTSDKYTATVMWGYSVIDILHAAKRTAAINSDIKNTKLKYIAKFENIAKPNRTYIDGEDGKISKFYKENKIFLMNEKNEYTQIPDEFQDVGKKLYSLQAIKEKIGETQYKKFRKKILDENKKFIVWFREVPLKKNHTIFISGKKLLRSYLLDDLWETEQVDELYNQSSFMLAKIVPTTYQRICTMGTASIWNLLLTTWSYENDLAIPEPDVKEHFSGGLARTFKVGYSRRIVKIDYASLYPMLQLTHNIFPIFDITGVMKKMLLYLTTTRNIYKRIANGSKLNNEELILLKEIDHEMYHKVINNSIDKKDIAKAKVKQLPIKILNNSLYGALGSDISFNWSDNISAAHITGCARIELRHAIDWFSKFDCIPLLAVTDGINFSIPERTKIKVTDDAVNDVVNEGTIEEMWKYNGKIGIDALIEKFNDEEMRKPFMAVDNDGESISSLNLARINYALLKLVKDKKTGELKEKIKLTGNTIKSKTMPEYIEEFINKGLDLILHGKGKEFVDYYYDYVDDIRYMRIPLRKIASKSKIKVTISQYLKRGKNKNGQEKAKQAHMELLIFERNKLAEKIFEEHRDEIGFGEEGSDKNLTIEDKKKLIEKYMPPEPELDTMVYYYNTGYRKSHGESRIIKDVETKKERMASKLLNLKDIEENPDMTGTYNYEKYLDSFNKRVIKILVGFDPEIREKILVKINKNGDLEKNMFTRSELELKNFDWDSIEDAMYLENPEIKFWNKTGLNPFNVWKGVKIPEDNPIYFDIYDDVLKFVNDEMKKNGKPEVKSVNDNYGAGDLVLLKNDFIFSIGLFDGIAMKIIKENIKYPKTKKMLDLEREKKKKEEKINELKMNFTSSNTEKEYNFLITKRKKYFNEFAKENNISEDIGLNDILEYPNVVAALDDFIFDIESEMESEAINNLESD